MIPCAYMYARCPPDLFFCTHTLTPLCLLRGREGRGRARQALEGSDSGPCAAAWVLDLPAILQIRTGQAGMPHLPLVCRGPKNGSSSCVQQWIGGAGFVAGPGARHVAGRDCFQGGPEQRRHKKTQTQSRAVTHSVLGAIRAACARAEKKDGDLGCGWLACEPPRPLAAAALGAERCRPPPCIAALCAGRAATHHKRSCPC